MDKLQNKSNKNLVKDIETQQAPKISVIIPVYNVEKYLEECIDSVQKQTLKDIEIICVNDGSRDSSLDILKRLAEDDERIIIIDQKNAGAGAARNTGIKAAKGKYLGFVDSDDLLFPTMYEELYEKAEKTGSDMVITGEIETFFDDNIIFPIPGSPLTKEELCLGAFKAIEYPEILKNVFLWNRIFSREFWLKNKFVIPEGRKFAEDLLICTQASVLAEKIGYVEGPLYKYRNFREDSLSYTLAKSKNKLDFIKATDETKKFLKSTKQYDFFSWDFLQFTTHLFAMLQEKMADYKFYCEFFEGYRSLLDDSDIELIKRSWLFYGYTPLITALETGNVREAFKQRIPKAKKK